MATARTQVTEPATPDEATVEVIEPAIPETVPGRKHDPRKLVYVYDKTTGDKLPNPVPETWLDGRFPNLSETPSKKAGK
ncbi:hypothetical protein HYQ00_gp12 [Arthrobacter phage TripleJ]|uniref:Uncharacterized protein n=1 Tax=Arthrobacter phage TripleJ TaxID=2599838 RepID=A0A5J6TFM0_9CAUD|nr:hypothetical protein HYQ00_gp12 [Arthrobacter phage TripleJ]QFG09556.1 hypothetical protein PBI_TRIPLEJ_12 [Arthrobacter phage TripleJ]